MRSCIYARVTCSVIVHLLLVCTIAWGIIVSLNLQVLLKEKKANAKADAKVAKLEKALKASQANADKDAKKVWQQRRVL